MAKFLIVEARFYAHLNDMLIAGARGALEAAGHPTASNYWGPALFPVSYWRWSMNARTSPMSIRPFRFPLRSM